jgi:outer membrane immunogenic protein
MKLLSGILATTLSCVVAFAPANAADLYGTAGGYKDGPAYAAVNWSGFYAGVNGGGAWAGNNQLVDPYGFTPGFGGISPGGGFGGGQIGYNFQGLLHPHLVFGIEADIQGGGIGASGSDVDVGYGPTVYRFRSNLDYFGTVRGRAGYVLDRALIYFTGGFAYGGLRKWSSDYNGLAGGQSFDSTTAGYALGGGAEFKVTPEWSVKAEYQYLNFGQNDLCGGAYCFTYYAGPQHDDDYHTVRLGVNYHFVEGFAALK